MSTRHPVHGISCGVLVAAALFCAVKSWPEQTRQSVKDPVQSSNLHVPLPEVILMEGNVSLEQ